MTHSPETPRVGERPSGVLTAAPKETCIRCSPSVTGGRGGVASATGTTCRETLWMTPWSPPEQFPATENIECGP